MIRLIRRSGCQSGHLHRIRPILHFSRHITQNSADGR
nr:MAG TPA: hypothetical protein [Inoviridae sp.]